MQEHQYESDKQADFYDCSEYDHMPRVQSQPYVKSALTIYSRKSFLPSYEVKYQLSLLREKLLLEKDKLNQQLSQQTLLEETIGEQQLRLYKEKKKQSSDYRMAMGIVNRVKAIYDIIDTELQSRVVISGGHNHDLEQPDYQHFQHEQHAFTHLIQAIQQLTTFYFQQQQTIRESHTSNNNDNKTINSEKQIQIFLSNLYSAISESVARKTTTVKYKRTVHDKLQEILKRYDLPVRRNQQPKDRQSRTPKMGSQDRQLLQRLLHWQSCEFALNTYLSSSSPSVPQPNKQQHYNSSKWQSQFFNLYYEKLQSSISYLFIQNHQSHSLLQPNWMFQYVQEVFVANYQWLRDNVLVGLKGQTEGNILVYVFQYALDKLFYNNIKSRLLTDLSTSQFLSTPLHSYKFIDSLYQLQQKLNITFSQHLTLVQTILIEFQLQHSQQQKPQLLQKCFDYQHQWIQQKIFKVLNRIILIIGIRFVIEQDFWQNINYSNIDLRNIETYNIVVNFNVLFQKLYTKFSTVYDRQLVQRINTFYQSQIRNLVAHIKTSLQRIYYHSGLDKLSIILAFKRVDNEFRSGLGQFISTNLQFEKEIKKQYYDYLISLFNELTVEMLAVHARKLLKTVTELQHLFNAQSVTQQEHIALKNKSEQIFKKWSHKIEQLNLVYPTKDNKIKNQFFVFLQSITFNQKGIMMFLEFYQPFLKITYGVQQFNILKMVILMDKNQQLDFLKVNATPSGGQLNFLLESESTAIKKMLIK